MFTQARLILAGLLLLAFTGVAGVALWYRGQAISAAAKTELVEVERDKARNERDQAITVNAENLAEMARIKAEDERKQRIIVGMADEIADINIELLEKTEAYNALKEADADVSKYLSQPIPDALRRLRVNPKAGAADNRQNQTGP